MGPSHRPDPIENIGIRTRVTSSAVCPGLRTGETRHALSLRPPKWACRYHRLSLRQSCR